MHIRLGDAAVSGPALLQARHLLLARQALPRPGPKVSLAPGVRRALLVCARAGEGAQAITASPMEPCGRMEGLCMLPQSKATHGGGGSEPCCGTRSRRGPPHLPCLPPSLRGLCCWPELSSKQSPRRAPPFSYLRAPARFRRPPRPPSPPPPPSPAEPPRLPWRRPAQRLRRHRCPPPG